MSTQDATAANATGYSPGHWEIRDDADLWAISEKSFREDRHIARFLWVGASTETPNGPHDYEFPESDANMRLCAAAPQMLAALEMIAAQCSPLESTHDVLQCYLNREHRDAILAAITAARGLAPCPNPDFCMCQP